MEKWLERVIEEKDQLEKKLDKLDAYIVSDVFDSLDKGNKLLLMQQQAFMSCYLRILEERINYNIDTL